MRGIQHIAIIPDGNRRWAKKRVFPILEGHKYSADKVIPALIEATANAYIPYITFWAFSTENNGREAQEVKGLFQLLQFFLDNKIDEFRKKGVKLRVIGNRSKLSQPLQDSIQKAEDRTSNNTTITVIFALNYGGRDEITRAVQKIVSESIPLEEITPQVISNALDTSEIPDPDIIIRTGGDKRLSGFMLWQAEYAELFFTNTLFPDFSPEELQQIIDEYTHRERRFGT